MSNPAGQSGRVFWLLEFILQSTLGWAYYPARVSRGGSCESVGSHRVPEGSFLHHRRDECAPSRAISARETGALGRGDERERKAYRGDLAERRVRQGRRREQVSRLDENLGYHDARTRCRDDRQAA